jgi:hypothetical protein
MQKGTIMSNVGSIIAKAAALAGGAVIGAFLASLLDKFISSQVQEHPDYDKSRYAQGLTPLAPQPLPPVEEQQ